MNNSLIASIPVFLYRFLPVVTTTTSDEGTKTPNCFKGQSGCPSLCQERSFPTLQANFEPLEGWVMCGHFHDPAIPLSALFPHFDVFFCGTFPNSNYIVMQLFLLFPHWSLNTIRTETVYLFTNVCLALKYLLKL